MTQIDIFDEIIVDNFAGGGGASTGIELAAVCPPLAEAMVKANFPEWNIGKLDTMAQFHDAVAV